MLPEIDGVKIVHKDLVAGQGLTHWYEPLCGELHAEGQICIDWTQVNCPNCLKMRPKTPTTPPFQYRRRAPKKPGKEKK